MARNSVTGRFRDIEIAFTIDGDCTMMSVRNLVNEEKRVRVMYQKLAASGLATWVNFQLTNAPVLRRLPTEILGAYRLTFFVDEADPVSARVEKIVDELNALKSELPAENTPEDTAELNGHTPEARTVDQDETRTPLLKAPEEPAAVPATSSLEMPTHEAEGPASESEIKAVAQGEAKTVPHTSEVDTTESVVPEDQQKPAKKSAPAPIVMKLPNTQNAVPVSQIVDSNLEFKIAVPALPPSALVEQRKAQVAAHLSATTLKAGTAASRRREKGVLDSSPKR